MTALSEVLGLYAALAFAVALLPVQAIVRHWLTNAAAAAEVKQGQRRAGGAG